MSDLAAFPNLSQVLNSAISSNPPSNSRDSVLNNMGKYLLDARKVISKSISLTASATAETLNVFDIGGVNEVVKIEGYTTQPLLNCTGAYLDVNDGTSTVYITENVIGATLTDLPTNSYLSVIGNNTVALNAQSSTACFAYNNLNSSIQLPMLIGQAVGSNTKIRFTYTTSDTPTSGAIMFTIVYRPLTGQAQINPSVN